jgi:antitoxin CcdA
MRMTARHRSTIRKRPAPRPVGGRHASAAKKPTNVSIDRDLLLDARALNINLSQALEDRLIELIRAARENRWLAENEGAIADYNDRIERAGVFGDTVRRF